MWLHDVLQRVMNARQFGLKLIANVTYGYTSAGFSGRMPMAEIADSIVQVSSLLQVTVIAHCCILCLVIKVLHPPWASDTATQMHVMLCYVS